MLAVPRRGAVIRYAYLWADESRRGQEEGRKDRLSLVLAVAVQQTEILVLAITHTPPADPAEAVPLPDTIKRALGLDTESSWIVTSEANSFFWPGPDLRPIPGRKPPTAIYGYVPDALLRQVARSYLANRERRRTRTVQRTW